MRPVQFMPVEVEFEPVLQISVKVVGIAAG